MLARRRSRRHHRGGRSHPRPCPARPDAPALREEAPYDRRHLWRHRLRNTLTGWRCGDMLGLRWSAVDMPRGVIRLFQGETKNDEGRTLAIAGPLAEIMARRQAARLAERRDGEPVVADLVFHNRGHGVVDYRRAWATAGKAAGFVYRGVNEQTGRRELGRRMHDLRRTAARDRVDDGTPERVVMAMTGPRREPCSTATASRSIWRPATESGR